MFWDFQKNEYFLGYEDLVGGGGSFLCILGTFFKIKVQNGCMFFGVAKISNIFFFCYA